jgi:hypothetical protein
MGFPRAAAANRRSLPVGEIFLGEAVFLPLCGQVGVESFRWARAKAIVGLGMPLADPRHDLGQPSQQRYQSACVPLI